VNNAVFHQVHKLVVLCVVLQKLVNCQSELVLDSMQDSKPVQVGMQLIVSQAIPRKTSSSSNNNNNTHLYTLLVVFFFFLRMRLRPIVGQQSGAGTDHHSAS